MKASLAALFVILTLTPAYAQNVDASLSNLPMNLGDRGDPIQGDGAAKSYSADQLRSIQTDIPTARLSKVAGQPFSEAGASTRSAKDAEIYRTASPSVVLI